MDVAGESAASNAQPPRVRVTSPARKPAPNSSGLLKSRRHATQMAWTQPQRAAILDAIGDMANVFAYSSPMILLTATDLPD